MSAGSDMNWLSDIVESDVAEMRYSRSFAAVATLQGEQRNLSCTM